MSGEQWGEAVPDEVSMAGHYAYGRGLGTSGTVAGIEAAMAVAYTAGREAGVADTRRKVAEEIEATFAANARSELNRPKVERGGFLNDRGWAVAIARGSGNGDGGTSKPTGAQPI